MINLNQKHYFIDSALQHHLSPVILGLSLELYAESFHYQSGVFLIIYSSLEAFSFCWKIFYFRMRFFSFAIYSNYFYFQFWEQLWWFSLKKSSWLYICANLNHRYWALKKIFWILLSVFCLAYFKMFLKCVKLILFSSFLQRRLVFIE